MTELESRSTTARSTSPVAGEVARGDCVRAARHRDRGALERAVAVAQEDGDLVEARIGDGQVGAAVVVEVGRHDGRRAAPWRQGDGQGLLERAVAVARQDGHAVRALVDDGHAEVAVAGEVAGGDGGRVIADHAAGRFLERAVALAKQHGDVGGADVSGGQVKAAVAVEIARDDIDRGRPCRHAACIDHAAAGRRTVDRGLKRPVAVAQEHRDIVGVGVGDGQIEMAVAEVARHDRVGVRPDGERRHRLGLERAVAVALQMSTALVLASVTARSRLPVPKSPATMRCRSAAREARWFAWPRNSPALIGQDGDVAGVDVGDGQEVAVLAEVARGDRDGAQPDRDRVRRE